MHIRVGKAEAETAKRMLSKYGMLGRGISVQHRSSYVYFPVSNIDRRNIKKVLESCRASTVDIAPRPGRPADYREGLREALGGPAAGFDTGYDRLGNIAVIDPKGMTGAQERALARHIVDGNRTITTVLAKDGPVEGRYRTRKVRYVAGKRTFEARCREHGCTFEFDVRKTFFSARLAFERARVAELARHDRHVIVMFAGIGPFAIQIAKRNRSAEVVAIELNRYACGQMKREMELNRTPNVVPVQGDVKRIGPRYDNFADRIVMPLPKTSIRFLDDAYAMAGNGCVVHLYAFVRLDGLDGLIGRIREHAKRNSYSVRVLFTRTVRNYSAREMEAVVDYRIGKRPAGRTTQQVS